MNFRPLIAEKDDNGKYSKISLGRISFWIVFGIAIYVWLFGTGDIHASHLQMLYITATYNLAKKVKWVDDNSGIRAYDDSNDDEDAPRVP